MKNKLRELRKERDLSQEKFGQLIGVSRQTINSIENGKYDPSLPLAFEIVSVFDLTIENVFFPDKKG